MMNTLFGFRKMMDFILFIVKVIPTLLNATFKILRELKL